MMLNIGCGVDKKEDYVNVDVNPLVDPDLVLDIENELLPYKNVKKILLYHVLEHLQSPLKALEHCSNVLCNGGVIKVKVPHKSHFYAVHGGLGWHVTGFGVRTFNSMKRPKVFYPFSFLFSRVKTKIVFPKWLFFMNCFNCCEGTQVFYEHYISNIIPATELHVLLIK